MRADIAKWAIANGTRPGCKRSLKFPSPPFVDLSNCTKKANLVVEINDLESIPRKRRGGYKLQLEEIDEKVINLIKEMSYNIVISIAKCIVCANDRTLLREYGGNI